MSFVNKFINLTSYYQKINPNTLSGSSDVIVLKNKTLRATPFHLRFGKKQIFKIADHHVNLFVNGDLIKIGVKVGNLGEIYFESDDVDQGKSYAGKNYANKNSQIWRENFLCRKWDGPLCYKDFDFGSKNGKNENFVEDNDMRLYADFMTHIQNASHAESLADMDVQPNSDLQLSSDLKNNLDAQPNSDIKNNFDGTQTNSDFKTNFDGAQTNLDLQNNFDSQNNLDAQNDLEIKNEVEIKNNFDAQTNVGTIINVDAQNNMNLENNSNLRSNEKEKKDLSEENLKNPIKDKTSQKKNEKSPQKDYRAFQDFYIFLQQQRKINRKLRNFYIEKDPYAIFSKKYKNFNSLLSSFEHFDFLLKNYKKLFYILAGLIKIDGSNQKCIFKAGRGDTNFGKFKGGYNRRLSVSGSSISDLRCLCYKCSESSKNTFGLNVGKNFFEGKKPNIDSNENEKIRGCPFADLSYSLCAKESFIPQYHAAFQKFRSRHFQPNPSLIVRIKGCESCNIEFYLFHTLFSDLFFYVRNLLQNNYQNTPTKLRNYLSNLINEKFRIKPCIKYSTQPTELHLKSMNLKPGKNTLVFQIDGTSKSLSLDCYLIDKSTKIVITDIDGTITKSDKWGHVYSLIGKDWTHNGVAEFFTKISRNGYFFVYLSSRPIVQIGITKRYLMGVCQDGFYLPEGPVLLSPDGILGAIYREVILGRPEEWKIGCMENVAALFQNECEYVCVDECICASDPFYNSPNALDNEMIFDKKGEMLHDKPKSSYGLESCNIKKEKHILDFQNTINAKSMKDDTTGLKSKNIINANSMKGGKQILDTKSTINANLLKDGKQILDFKNTVDANSMKDGTHIMDRNGTIYANSINAGKHIKDSDYNLDLTTDINSIQNSTNALNTKKNIKDNRCNINTNLTGPEINKNQKKIIKAPNPFVAGFGNRKTDIITYKALGINKNKIFTINSQGRIIPEFTMSVSNSYLSLNNIVDNVFPPLKKAVQERSERNQKWWMAPENRK